jgi:hypothetical protein
MTKIFEVKANPFKCCPALGKVVRKTRADGKTLTADCGCSNYFVMLEPVLVFDADDGAQRSYEQWDSIMYGPYIVDYDGELFFVDAEEGVVRSAAVIDLPSKLVNEYMPAFMMSPEEIYKGLRNKGARFFCVTNQGDTVMVVGNECIRVACSEAYKLMEKLGYLNTDGTLKKTKLGKDLLNPDGNKAFIVELHRYAR